MNTNARWQNAQTRSAYFQHIIWHFFCCFERRLIWGDQVEHHAKSLEEGHLYIGSTIATGGTDILV